MGLLRAALVLMSFMPPFLAGAPVAALAGDTAPVAGVSRALASERAGEVSGVRYRLSFDLAPHASVTAAREELHFKLNRVAPLWLDFREGNISRALLNEHSLRPILQNGHLALPSSALRPGENRLLIDFTAPVAPAGKAITSYADKDDGSEYIYTLFVPMDASMAFPCFDQPDLKARFMLDVTAPNEWTVLSNSAVEHTDDLGEKRRTLFSETRPISTYLFAFAAGHFESVHTTPGLPNIYVRHSQLARAAGEAQQIQSVVSRATQFLSQYFAEPFPFPKYDMVLLPGFAYGGMEHAGATFLREDAMLFRSAPTDTDRFNRAITLVHELVHQWFGDFVTMRWFDDLWLKEGFAQYMAFRTMAAIQPDENVWKRFYQSIKPAAYGIDVTQGTTPIYQDIANLKDAKSAYGAIVYSKAPGLLRQLAYLLGDDAFRDGLRVYLKAHAYGNAEWSDLVHALEQASHKDLTAWARDWIRRRGMPEVRVSWSCNPARRVDDLVLTQHDVLNEGGVWPVATEVLLGYKDQKAVPIRVQFSTAKAIVRDAAGAACPDYVFTNAEDYGYGMFLLDEKSRSYIMANLASISDLFQRTLLWGAMWDAVRFVQLAPRKYLALSRDSMPQESDEALVQALGNRAAVALHEYVSPAVQAELSGAFGQMSVEGMLHSSNQGLRIMWFRNLRSMADDSFGLTQLRRLLNGSENIPGVQLRPLDRWSIVTTLIAHGYEGADSAYHEEQTRDRTGDGLKYSYMAGAAKPDAETKKWYFNDYTANSSRPEDWVEQSLGAFNYWNQSELTSPYLLPALQALPQVKQQRKIFFVLSWLNAFIDGQNSVEADRAVHSWLGGAPLDHDLQLKVLQVVDDLDRTVKIRQRFP